MSSMGSTNAMNKTVFWIFLTYAICNDDCAEAWLCSILLNVTWSFDDVLFNRTVMSTVSYVNV